MWYPPAVSATGQSVERQVVALALPAIAQSLVGTLVFVVHRLVLGRYEANALAAMQIASTLAWTMSAVFTALAPGTIAVVGRSIGAGDVPAARAAARAALGVGLAGGLFVCAVGTPGIRWVIDALFPTAEPVVAELAHRYLRIVLLGQPALYVATLAASVLQGAGNTRLPLRAAVTAQVTNLLLCVGLVFGLGPLPELGIAGAAWASVAAFGLEALVLLQALGSTRGPLPLRGPSAALGASLARVGRVSAPALAERIVYHVGMTGYFAILARLGTEAMAANQALISIESISFLSADGFGIAAAAIVALRLGAGKPEEAEQGARTATRLAILALTGFGAAFAIARLPLVSAFSEGEAIRAMGAQALLVGALAQPFMAITVVKADALRGAGDTRTVLAVAFCGAVVVRLTATWTFTHVIPLGLTGVWMGSGVDWLFRAAILTWLFRRGGWKTRSV
jgi:putative MATE family efflux protein